jgi:hypothetical protein
MKLFTESEFLDWVNSKPQSMTYDGVDNYTCPIAQFLNETGRTAVAYVLSEQWYDETKLTKKGKPSALYPVPSKVARAVFALAPVNTFEHISVRLSLLMEGQEMNDYYFIMKDRKSNVGSRV